METQMVRSLGVKIGGRTVPAEPMEMVRNSLSHSAHPVSTDGQTVGGEATGDSKCPFSDMINDVLARHEGDAALVEEASDRLRSLGHLAIEMTSAERRVELLSEVWAVCAGCHTGAH